MSISSLAEALKILFDNRNRVNPSQGNPVIRITEESRETLRARDSILFELNEAAPVINRPPTVTIHTANQTLTANDTISLSATVSDPDGSIDNIEWTGDGTFTNPNSADTDWTAPGETPYKRNYELRLTATDNDGAIATQTVTISVPGGTAPLVVITTPAQTLVGLTTISLISMVTDLDNDIISYTWTGDGIFSDDSMQNTNWEAPEAQSTEQIYDLTLTVEDSQGSIGTDTVSITILQGARPGSFNITSLRSYREDDDDDEFVTHLYTEVSWSRPSHNGSLIISFTIENRFPLQSSSQYNIHTSTVSPNSSSGRVNITSTVGDPDGHPEIRVTTRNSFGSTATPWRAYDYP